MQNITGKVKLGKGNRECCRCGCYFMWTIPEGTEGNEKTGRWVSGTRIAEGRTEKFGDGAWLF